MIRVGLGSSSRPARLCALIVASIAFLALFAHLSLTINTKATAEALPPLASCDIPAFWGVIYKYAVMIPTASLAVGLARYFGGLARLEVRSTLTRRMQTCLFGTGKVCNYLSNIDATVDNIDQRIAADVEDATQQLVVFFLGGFHSDHSYVDGLLTNLYLTVATIHLFIKNVGLEAFGIFSVYTVFIAFLSLAFMRKVVKFTFRQQMYEGAFRYVHTRVKEYAESIVFYNGVDAEHESSNMAFNDVYNNQKSLILQTILCQGAPVVSSIAQSLLAYGLVALQMDVDAEAVTSPGSNVTAVMPTLNGLPLTTGRLQFVIGLMGVFLSEVIGLLGLFAHLPSIAGLVHRVGEMLEKLDIATDAVHSFDCTRKILSNPNEVVVENLTCATPDGSKVLFKNISFRVKKGNPSLSWGRVERARQACSAYLVDCGRFSKDLCRSQAQ